MRNYLRLLAFALGLILSFTAGARAQDEEQPLQPPPGKDAKLFSAQDLSGIWAVRPVRGIPWYNYALAGDDVPMTPWAEEKFKENKPSFGPHPQEDSNDLAYSCFPAGMPRVYAAVQAAMQIVQVHGRVLMFFGRNVRQIYTDGRPHPKDLHPLWMGHSIGHWEGDTLVIDTVAINDRNWLDRMGHPHSDALHLVERFHRVAADTLNLDMMIDDPKAFTKTWTAQRTFRLRPPSSRMGEAICEDIFINEAFGLKPTLPSMK